MRIGLFGGSFDPTHVEHINLAKGAIQSLSLDKLIVLPAHTPPHKQGKTLTPDSVRLELCKLAFLDVDKVEVNGYEIEKGGVSYTYETCRYFRSLYPSAQLFWIVGTDMLRNFPTWKNPKEILETTTLAVCARAENNGWLEKEKDNFYKLFGKDFALIDYDGKDVSSTKIRVLASAGEDVSAFVGERVAKYIKEERLYEIDGAKEALNLEKQSRKEHSLRVAEMSAQRAPSLGISEKKAITSALFHDCAKNLDRNSPYLDGFVLEKDVPAPVEHQFAGAYLAEKKFGVKDEDILNSIRYHTSGRAGMSALERLIFLADMLEYGRDYDVVAKLRELFWDKTDDLTVCMAVALKESLRFIKEKGAPVYELTVEAEKYYAEKMKNRQQGNSLTKKEKNYDGSNE